MRYIRLMALVFAGLAVPCFAQPQMTDVALLQVLFPHATAISRTANKHIDHSGKIDGFKIRDALAGSTVYRVDGAPKDDMEKCLASDVRDNNSFGTKREVRLKTMSWPGMDSSILVLIQYRFIDGAPPGSCAALSRLFRLSRHGAGWTVSATHEFGTVHHWTIQKFEMIGELTRPLLSVVTDESGGGFYNATLSVFDLGAYAFKPVLEQDEIATGLEGDIYTQSLDPKASRRKGDNYLCFTKRIFAHDGRRIHPSEISHPCYLLDGKPAR